jgi:hypothetical protein
MLDEVQLLIASRFPKILTAICQIFFLLFALLFGEGLTALFAKGRISQNIIISTRRGGDQCVCRRYKVIAVYIAYVAEEEVYQRQAAGTCHDLIAIKRLVFKKLVLLFVQFVMVYYVS